MPRELDILDAHTCSCNFWQVMYGAAVANISKHEVAVFYAIAQASFKLVNF